MNYGSSYAPRDIVQGSMGLSEAIPDIRKFKPMVADWRRRYRFRADLKRLLKVGPYMIKDIGLTHEEALRESQKPVWKP